MRSKSYFASSIDTSPGKYAKRQRSSVLTTPKMGSLCDVRSFRELPVLSWVEPQRLSADDQFSLRDGRPKKRKIYDDKVFVNNTREKVQLSYEGTATGLVVKWVFPFNYNTTDARHSEESLPNKPTDKLFDLDLALFTESEGGKMHEPDPETLDDSDIDNLYYELEASKESVTETEQEFVLKEEDLTVKNNNRINKYIKSHILVGTNAFYIQESSLLTSTSVAIEDCKIIPSTDTKFDDTVLLLRADGYLLSISPRKTYNKETVVLQYWRLDNSPVNKLDSEKSEIVLNGNNNTEFVVINRRLGSVKIFRLDTTDSTCPFLKFQLVDSMLVSYQHSLDKCCFFPNPHSLLFILASNRKEHIFYCIELDNTRSKDMSINELRVEDLGSIDSVTPLGSNMISLFDSEQNLRLITPNHIVSDTAMPPKLKLHKFGKLITSFNSPELLHVLQNLPDDSGTDFKSFSDCTMFATDKNSIGCIVTNKQNDIKMFFLTRFKDLKQVCPTSNQPTDNSAFFNINILSFNRFIELTIDTNHIQQVPFDRPETIYPSFKSVNRHKTLLRTSKKAVSLISIDSKKELWVSGKGSLSQPSPNDKLFIRKTQVRNNRISSFQVFNSINFINGNSVVGHSLLWLTDNIGITKLFSVEKPNNDINLVELDDVLCIDDKKTLFLKVYDTFVIQVVNDSVMVRSLLDDMAISTIFTSDFNFEKYRYFDDKLLLWNCSNKKIWFIANLAEGPDCIVKETRIFDELITCHSFEMYFTENESEKDCNIILKSIDTAFATTWDTLTSSNCDDIQMKSKVPTSDSMVSPIDIIRQPFEFCSPKFCCYSQISNNGDTDVTVSGIHCENKQTAPFPTFKFCMDIRIKNLTPNLMTIFTNSLAYFVYLKDDNTFHFAQIALPFRTKYSNIVDIATDNVQNHIYVLYSDGMQILESDYLTRNLNDYYLEELRSGNNIFFFLEKINRMLIIDKNTNEWYCLKLETGRLFLLNTGALKKEGIIDMAEVPTMEKSVSLIIKYKDSIQYVKIIPRGKHLRVTSMDIFEANSAIVSGTFEVSNKHEFYIIKEQIQMKLKDNDNTSGERSQECIQFKIQDDKLSVVFSLRLERRIMSDNILTFNNDRVILAAVDNEFTIINRAIEPCIPIHQHIRAEHCVNKVNMRKMIKLNDVSFVYVYSELASEVISKVMFFCLEGIYEEQKFKGDIENSGDENETESIYDIETKQRLAKLKTKEINLFNDIGLEYGKVQHPPEESSEVESFFEESHATISNRESILSTIKTKTENSYSYPQGACKCYRTISFPQLFQDLAYDSRNQILYILTTNGDVIKLVKTISPQADEEVLNFEVRQHAGHWDNMEGAP